MTQSELELFDEVDHLTDRKQFEDQHFDVKAKFNEILHPVVDQPQSSLSAHSNTFPKSHASTHIKLPTITLATFEGDTCNWLHSRDTFEALIVNNTTLSSVQMFHYFITSLKNEAKALINNQQITNGNFLVVCQLVTQRYNNKRLIAMTHTKQLCQMPPVKRGESSSLRQLTNQSHKGFTSIDIGYNLSRLRADSYDVSYPRC
jgi:hypothetical protein